MRSPAEPSPGNWETIVSIAFCWSPAGASVISPYTTAPEGTSDVGARCGFVVTAAGDGEAQKDRAVTRRVSVRMCVQYRRIRAGRRAARSRPERGRTVFIEQGETESEVLDSEAGGVEERDRVQAGPPGGCAGEHRTELRDLIAATSPASTAPVSSPPWLAWVHSSQKSSARPRPRARPRPCPGRRRPAC